MLGMMIFIMTASLFGSLSGSLQDFMLKVQPNLCPKKKKKDSTNKTRFYEQGETSTLSECVIKLGQF
jgi:hypothetical protein